MAIFDKAEPQIQDRSDLAREEQRDKLWRTQCLPEFARGGITQQQIEPAKAMFCAGFDAGWHSHQAFLLKEFIRENKTQKVHLA
jgi:hypothetical protein